ncbi:nucleotide-sugar transporter-domain-containing protein [Pavlovales sp. CCMP2436]|nr:nucleotide-sugar transporter-domain-containing protein [Pavlovales sp. CCMP2436]
MELHPAFLKYVSLLALLLQNCLVIILTRVVKQRTVDVAFVSSVAVLAAEVLKFALCAGAKGCELGGAIRDSGSLRAVLRDAIVDHGWSTLKCSVPALCYTIQNNLIYYALGKLEVVVFQLLYQSKLLLTAALSVCILGKALRAQQWGSLLMLFGGVVLVQLSGGKAGGSAIASVEAAGHANGVLAAVAGSTLSAFAGVYFELILKADLQVSLWVRNLQLCLFTVPISLATVWCNDREAVSKNGVLGGFDTLVWSVVLTQAFGGIIVASCMKYADNIMKNFASSGAIVLGGAASVFFFNFKMTPQFAVGAGVVVASILVYDPTLCDCSSAEPLSDISPLRSLDASEVGDEDSSLIPLSESDTSPATSPAAQPARGSSRV